MKTWMLVLAVAAAVAVAVALLLSPRPEQAPAPSSCSLVPVAATMYVSNGCGVGVVEVLAAGECWGYVSIDGVEVYGYGVAEPLQPRVAVRPGAHFYIVVYGSKEGVPRAIVVAERSDADRLVNEYLGRGLCLQGVWPGTGYPGALHWDGRTVFFDWRAAEHVIP